jgi:hypothetical protein
MPNSEAYAVPFKELRFTVAGLGSSQTWCVMRYILLHGRTNTDGKTKLTVAFRNFANAPKKTQTELFSLERMRHQEQLHLHTQMLNYVNFKPLS